MSSTYDEIFRDLSSTDSTSRYDALHKLKIDLRKHRVVDLNIDLERLVRLLNECLVYKVWSVSHQTLQLLQQVVGSLGVSQNEEEIVLFLENFTYNTIELLMNEKVLLRRGASRLLSQWNESYDMSKGYIIKRFLEHIGKDVSSDRLSRLLEEMTCIMESYEDLDDAMLYDIFVFLHASKDDNNDVMEFYEFLKNRFYTGYKHFINKAGIQEEKNVTESMSRSFSSASMVSNSGFIGLDVQLQQALNRIEDETKCVDLLQTIDDHLLRLPISSSLQYLNNLNKSIKILTHFFIDTTDKRIILVAFDILNRLIQKVGLDLMPLLPVVIEALVNVNIGVRGVVNPLLMVFIELFKSFTPKAVLRNLLALIHSKNWVVRFVVLCALAQGLLVTDTVADINLLMPVLLEMATDEFKPIHEIVVEIVAHLAIVCSATRLRLQLSTASISQRASVMEGIHAPHRLQTVVDSGLLDTSIFDLTGLEQRKQRQKQKTMTPLQQFRRSHSRTKIRESPSPVAVQPQQRPSPTDVFSHRSLPRSPSFENDLDEGEKFTINTLISPLRKKSSPLSNEQEMELSPRFTPLKEKTPVRQIREPESPMPVIPHIALEERKKAEQKTPERYQEKSDDFEDLFRIAKEKQKTIDRKKPEAVIDDHYRINSGKLLEDDDRVVDTSILSSSLATLKTNRTMWSSRSSRRSQRVSNSAGRKTRRTYTPSARNRKMPDALQNLRNSPTVATASVVSSSVASSIGDPHESHESAPPVMQTNVFGMTTPSKTNMSSIASINSLKLDDHEKSNTFPPVSPARRTRMQSADVALGSHMHKSQTSRESSPTQKIPKRKRPFSTKGTTRGLANSIHQRSKHSTHFEKASTTLSNRQSVEEMHYDDLPELRDARGLVMQAMHEMNLPLKEQNWKSVFHGVTNIRCVLKHEPGMLKNQLTDVIKCLVQQTQNLRSTICKNAVVALGEMCMAYQRRVDQFVDPILRALLRKVAEGGSSFISEEADHSLQLLIENCSPSRVFLSLFNGIKTKSSQVRSKIALCIDRCILQVGEEIESYQHFSRLINITSRLFVDSSQDCRAFSRKCFMSLIKLIGTELVADAANKFAIPDALPKILGVVSDVENNGSFDKSPAGKSSTRVGFNPGAQPHSVRRTKKRVQSGRQSAGARMSEEAKMEFKRIVVGIQERDWRKRISYLSMLSEFCEANALPDKITPRILDILSDGLSDGNAKVQTHTLSITPGVLSKLKNLSKHFNLILPKLCGLFTHSNRFIIEQISELCDAIESGDYSVSKASIMRNYSSTIPSFNTNLQAVMLERCTDFVEIAFVTDSKAVAQYGVALAIRTMNTKGVLQNANRNFVTALLQLFGEKKLLGIVRKLAPSAFESFGQLLSRL
ncbi:hypothetical protein PCE1_003186 [Barthelona sp. PCE]